MGRPVCRRPASTGDSQRLICEIRSRLDSAEWRPLILQMMSHFGLFQPSGRRAGSR